MIIIGYFNQEKVNEIFNKTKSTLTKDIPKEEMGILMKKLNSIKGVFLPSPSIEEENRTVYTSTGKPILEEGEKFNGTCEKLSLEQKALIQEEIVFLIKLKYNFIHYNGFPRVHEVELFTKGKKVDKKVKKGKKTENQKLLDSFIEKYQYNLKNHSVISPFKENVIIIDEVHNFINEIINGSAPANIFYDWIVNGEDVKLIFLSGTPIINKPAEIAILYNMLRGVLHVYEFSLSSNRDEYELQQELRDLFYQENSSIEQLSVSKRKGKMILSIGTITSPLCVGCECWRSFVWHVCVC